MHFLSRWTWQFCLRSMFRQNLATSPFCVKKICTGIALGAAGKGKYCTKVQLSMQGPFPDDFPPWATWLNTITILIDAFLQNCQSPPSPRFFLNPRTNSWWEKRRDDPASLEDGIRRYLQLYLLGHTCIRRRKAKQSSRCTENVILLFPCWYGTMAKTTSGPQRCSPSQAY